MKQLSNLELEEVSLVDKGAVPRTFLIVKQDSTNIRIESDGTTGKLFVNDQELTDISGFSFNLWGDNEIRCSYTKCTTDTTGFEKEETFYLVGSGDVQTSKEFTEELKKYIKETIKTKFKEK
jgi:hypothetical protein